MTEHRGTGKINRGVRQARHAAVLLAVVGVAAIAIPMLAVGLAGDDDSDARPTSTVNPLITPATETVTEPAPAPVETTVTAPALSPVPAARMVKPLQDLARGDRVLYDAGQDRPLCRFVLWSGSIAEATIRCPGLPRLTVQTGFLTPVEAD